MSGGGTKDLEDLFQQPTVSFLPKPFEPSQLHALLNSALSRNQRSASSQTLT
jgi:DNA-binding response OmpR family regulator